MDKTTIPRELSVGSYFRKFTLLRPTSTSVIIPIMKGYICKINSSPVFYVLILDKPLFFPVLNGT